jgi:hypothetical protein
VTALRWLSLPAFALIVAGLVAVAFLTQTWFEPWMMVEAGSCMESPVGYYRFRVVAYELTAYEGTEVQDWLVIGDTGDFIAHTFLGAEICSKP